jgi:hypothetical protein
MRPGKKRRVIVRSAPNPMTRKISIEVSTDIKMEVWQGSVLLENEVLAIFLLIVALATVAACPGS